MISITRSIVTIEQLEALLQATTACYAGSLDDLRRSAVELTPEITNRHRQVLEAIHSRVAAATEVKSISRARDLLSEELSDYQKQAQRVVDGLKQSLASISQVLEQLTTTVGDQSAVQTKGIEAQITQLRSVLASDDLAEIRNVVSGVVQGLTVSIDDIQRQHTLLIAHFKDEINILHARLKAYEKKGVKPPETVAQPQPLTRVISGRPFSLLCVWITNWKHTFRPLPEQVQAEAFEALCLEINRAIGCHAEITRRDDDVIMIQLDISQATAVEVSKRLGSAQLDYSFIHAGKKRSVIYRLRTGIVHSRNEEDVSKLMQRFDQLANALRS